MGWFSEFFFEYETPRMALLKDRKIGVVCRLIQLGVLVYIIGWVFIYEKGYQSEDGIISSVSVKVKGVTSTNDSDHGFRVWDVADYVFPEQHAWLIIILSFTAQEGLTSPWSNLDESITKSYLANCTYEKDPLCPIFKLGNLIQTAGFDFNEVALKGGAVGIVIKWDCNLDFPEKYCRPTYDVHGLYGGGKQSSASLGYNFRYAKYFMEEKIEKRTLYKVFGIRFDIIVHGKIDASYVSVLQSLMLSLLPIPEAGTLQQGTGAWGVRYGQGPVQAEPCYDKPPQKSINRVLLSEETILFQITVAS
ncbi:P2RX1 protein, partial [Polypterus senegalus]